MLWSRNRPFRSRRHRAILAQSPDPVPITEAELDVFEAWFGDLFDELFGPHR